MKVVEFAVGQFHCVADEVNNSMKMTEYLELAKKTAGKRDDLYLALGMVGESGEIVDVLKKIVRDLNNGVDLKSTLNRRDRLVDELGDFMWYCVMYHEELVDDSMVFAARPCLDLHSAVASALDLTMCCTEWAALALNDKPVRTTGTLETALCNVSDICTAMEVSIYDVMSKNIDKLKERYPDGFKVGVK